MDQQFEHLSNAQIENYGDRTGPGPNQPDHTLDQAIESHLEACDGCRTRVLHFHRARFGLMNDQVPQTRGSGDKEGNPSSKNPAATNPAPKNTALQNPAPRATLFPGSSAHRSPDCPGEDAVRDLAAGLSSPDSAAARLTQHAAQCDHCGPILRAYTEDFADDLSSEDQALLNQLNSASPSWQKKMAGRMAGAVATSKSSALGEQGVAQPGSPVSPVLAGRGGEPPSAVQEKISPPPKSSRFHLPSLKWIFAPVALVATSVIAFFVWNAQRETPQKVERLLAQAYTEQRTMEMRIPFAAHADFKQTRGDTASLLNSPEALRKATDIIAANLKKNPDAPQWLLLSARLDLLNWNYKPAMRALEKISFDPIASSPEYALSRGLGLYEKAETEPNGGQSYGEAANEFGKVLQKHPNDPVALFNQAVACEKIFAFDCASSDWQLLLTIEKDPGWMLEAQRHLAALKEKKNPDH